MKEMIAAIPALSTHEHIGSISSVGMDPFVGFAADAQPGAACGDTELMDIVADPYTGGALSREGYRPPEGAGPDEKWRAAQPALLRIRGTGRYAALERACRALYNVPLSAAMADAEAYFELTSKIRRAYSAGLYEHNAQVFAAARVEKALKPVQIRYLMEMARGRRHEIESRDFVPILRVDELCSFLSLKGPDAEKAEAVYGIAPDGIGSLDALIELCFSLADTLKIPAIKQLQAYFRTLRVVPRTRGEAQDALRAGDMRAVQDYALTRELEEANRRGLPYQIHTGMAPQPDGGPMELCRTFERYPNVKFVLLHCYPYLSQCGYLAQTYPNVSLDAAWLAVLSPEVFRLALREWIGFVPPTAICLSADATNSEQFYGAYEAMREGLADVLSEKVSAGLMREGDAMYTAARLFRENAREIYGL